MARSEEREAMRLVEVGKKERNAATHTLNFDDHVVTKGPSDHRGASAARQREV